MDERCFSFHQFLRHCKNVLCFVGFTLDITSQANGWLCGRSSFPSLTTNIYFSGNVVTVTGFSVNVIRADIELYLSSLFS